MSFVKGLKCRECGREYPPKLLAGCENCFGPLEVDYHYESIAKVLTRDVLASRPKSIWKYRELLPIEADPVIGDLQSSISNTLIQLNVPDAYRGRVLSLLFLNRGMIPVGTALTGFLAENLGAPIALGSMGVALMICAGIAIFLRPKQGSFR